MGASRHRGWLLAAGLGLAAGPAGAQLNCDPGVEYYRSGAIRGCVLNGVHAFWTPLSRRLICASGAPIELYPEGQVRRCRLAFAHRDGRRSCAAGHDAELGRDGHLIGCAAPRR